MAGTPTHSLTLTHTHSPTKGPYMRSPEYNPVGTHLPSIRPPDGRYRRSVVDERGEARATQSSVLAGDGLLGEPPNVPKYPSLPTHGSQFWQEQCPILPSRYVPGSAGRNYLTHPSTAARLHLACQPLGKGPDLQPTRSERMLKPAAHLRSTSTRHLGPGRTQHQNPAPSSGVGNGRKQQQQQAASTWQQQQQRLRSPCPRPPSFI